MFIVWCWHHLNMPNLCVIYTNSSYVNSIKCVTIRKFLTPNQRFLSAKADSFLSLPLFNNLKITARKQVYWSLILQRESGKNAPVAGKGEDEQGHCSDSAMSIDGSFSSGEDNKEGFPKTEMHAVLPGKFYL